jgi:hypothetical protein
MSMRRRAIKQPSPSEHVEAVRFFQLVTMHVTRYPDLENLTAVPHGGERNVVVASKLRAEGVKAGYPDYLLDVARQGFHGLRIELKRVGAPPSAIKSEQHEWHRRLREAGYRCEVCRGWEEAWRVVCDYLAIPFIDFRGGKAA